MDASPCCFPCGWYAMAGLFSPGPGIAPPPARGRVPAALARPPASVSFAGAPPSGRRPRSGAALASLAPGRARAARMPGLARKRLGRRPAARALATRPPPCPRPNACPTPGVASTARNGRRGMYHEEGRVQLDSNTTFRMRMGMSAALAGG